MQVTAQPSEDEFPVGTDLGVEIRGQVKSARVVKTPFHPPHVKKG